MSETSTMKENYKRIKKHGFPKEVNSRSANKLFPTLFETQRFITSLTVCH
jgi:hypothetical protein